MFLVDNVALKLPPDRLFDQSEMTPCYVELRSSGWAGAEAILTLLGKGKSSKELLYLASALKRCLGERLARAAVDAAVTEARDGTRIKNLTVIKTYLQGG